MTMTRTVSAVLVAALATTAAPALAQNGNSDYDYNYDARYAGVDRTPVPAAQEAYRQTDFDYARARDALDARRNGAANVVDDGHAYVVREDLADYRDQDQYGYAAEPNIEYREPAYSVPVVQNVPAAYRAPVIDDRAPAQYAAPAAHYGAPTHAAPATHYRNDYRQGDYRQSDYRQGGQQYGIASAQIAPHLGYSMDQRENWLADCRDIYAQDDNHNERRGLIGSLLGALVGGVAGNRIGGTGERLAGTLIGAGVGGLAGAAIGGLFGGGGDRDRDRDDRSYGEIDECEAYLLRYERSAQTNSNAGYGGAHGQQNVRWVRVPIHTTRNSCNSCRDVVVEEWVEEEVVARRPKARRIIRKPAPVRTKTKRIKYVK